MKHALSSFALSLGLLLPLLAACSGNITEDQSLVDDSASTGTVDADMKAGRKKSCAAVGGACVGLSPSSCEGGHFADASKVSCGGGIGVACCITPPNSCVSAGGKCVGLTPSSCPGGHLGDATTYSCGGGIGVACCLP